MTKTIYNDFIGLNNISKTLRFELKPIGKTLEYIKKSKIFSNEETPDIYENDQKRNDYYPEMKKILDNAHKTLLQEGLSDFSKTNPTCDWTELQKAYLDYQKSDKTVDDKKRLEKVQAQFRDFIVNTLKNHSLYNDITNSTPSGYIKNEFKKNPDQLALKTFNRFATYFSGFQQNRKNIYTKEAQTTGAANRAINDNFPKFMECCRIFNALKTKYPQLIEQAENELKAHLNGETLDNIFKIANYGNVLAQSGISYFNTIISGVSTQDRKKIKGLNEIINENKQLNTIDNTVSKMPQLYKQILSDRETFSFIPESFQNDEEVVESIKEAGIIVINNVRAVKNLLSTLTATDNTIYIDSKALSTISISLFGSWDAIEQKKTEYVENLKAELKTETERDALSKNWDQKTEYALSTLNDLGIDATAYWKLENTQKSDSKSIPANIFKNIADSYANMIKKLEQRDAKQKLAEQEDVVEAIKDFADLMQGLYHIMSPLSAGKELERNAIFYETFDELFERISFVIPLYNKIRNYVTKKPSETKKIKLMFDVSTLAKGWDKGQEEANKNVIFVKENNYYLGIIRSKKINFYELAQTSSENAYKKMVYKQFQKPYLDLPRLTIHYNHDVYHPSEQLINRYNNKDHLKGSKSFDINFCHELIDYFKKSIKLNPDWDVFDFHFSPTKQYENINDFYQEITEQAYKISFINISADKIDTLVEKGDLLLFQIWNKDFAEKSKGHENMHTLYWRQIFSPENMNECIFKLNGGAELFYRSKSIQKPSAHICGEKILNRRDKNGKTIPEDIYTEIYKYINNKTTTLPATAQKYLNNVVIKDVKHTIIKDKHFTEDKFLFHVPISINWRAKNKSAFNDAINKCVKENIDDICYIGIDRGERHLIYLCLIDSKGHILKQKSYNTIQSTNSFNIQETDYHQKLDEREKSRENARKNWKTINQIKDLKNGYLSQVVHDISKMIIENNAVVILEDLNFGFKRGRFCIEKQVYQNFEKALIEKLNYLVFKDKGINEPGGVLKGYQLTEPMEPFKSLGKQTGILYYVPAHYTSKIDPTTGFANLFKSIDGEHKIKEFFSKFDSITYDAAKDAFAFKFNYKAVVGETPDHQNTWCVYSAKRRLVYSKKEQKTTEINPTQIIKEQLEKASVVLTDKYDLKTFMEYDNLTRNKQFFSNIYYAFTKTLQMRNSSAATGEDYIESPVLNANNTFFDSRKAADNLPKDADANGAFHIALKGLYALTNMNDKLEPVSNKDWLSFVQTRNT